MKILIMWALWTGLLFAGAQSQPAPSCDTVKADYLILPSGQIIHKSRLNILYQPISDLSLRYLKQIRQVLQQKGSTVVFLPIPYMDDIINPDIVVHENLPVHLQSYHRVMEQLRSTGILTIDLVPGALAQRKQGPFFFETLRDVHWTREGLELAANLTADALNQHLPDLMRQLQQDDVQINITGEYLYHGKSENAIRRACKGFPLQGDVFNRYTEEGSSTDLLTNPPILLTLLGTSYSANPPGLGFDYALARHLHTRVANQAINGGGPVGSLFEFFATHEPTPLLLWELPLYQVNRLDQEANSLSPVNLNQVLAYLLRDPQRTYWSSSGRGQQGQLNISVATAETSHPLTVFTLKLDRDHKTFVMKVTYTDHSTQNILFNRNYGSYFRDYAFLVPSGKTILQVEVKLEDQKPVNFRPS